MADVLPSCIGMEGLLYLLFSGFVQANKSHGLLGFPLILLQAKAGGEKLLPKAVRAKLFPLILLQAKAGGTFPHLVIQW